MTERKRVQPLDRIEVQGNKGGSFVGIDTDTGKDGTVHLRVGHECVIFIDRPVPVVVLAAALARIEIDGGIEATAERFGGP